MGTFRECSNDPDMDFIDRNIAAQIPSKKAKYGWNLSNLVGFIRMNIFVKINIWQWIEGPFITVAIKGKKWTVADVFGLKGKLEMESKRRF